MILATSRTGLLLLLLLIAFRETSAAAVESLDVTNYDVTVSLDIEKAYIEGAVSISYRLSSVTNTMVLKAGNLSVLSVEGSGVSGFEREGNLLTIHFYGHELSRNSESQPSEHRVVDNQRPEGVVHITYAGYPDKGLFFDPEQQTAHTVFFTEYWMVSNDHPGDKATISLSIAVPEGLDCVSNGELMGREEAGGRWLYRWRQDYATPSYVFGFAVGEFQRHEKVHEDVVIHSLSKAYSSRDLERIFQFSADMMSFFEQKTGIRYEQGTYSQVLLGRSYQELSGWSLLREDYGRMVLNDQTETNLISHEMAHQWWGNRITCATWSHFWLNEAFATFMSAAYNEHRFGPEKYAADIESYRGVYSDLVARGKDRSLVFEDWSNPSRDDRNLVYFKGAYVLHELRGHMGDEAFWKGVRDYSRQFHDEVVTTRQFQRAMEASSGLDLGSFFEDWVY